MPTTFETSVLRDTVSLVTGGGSGLGASIASELASHGAHVVVLDPDAAAANDLVEQVTRSGGSVEAVIADVRDAERLASVVELAASRGSLFSVVSNAGGWGGVPTHYPVSDPDDWFGVLDLNLIAPMRLLQVARPHVVAGGAIVHVSSIAGVESTPYDSPEYAVAKAGIVRLTTALPVVPRGVRVSCVVPGWVALSRARTELAAMEAEERIAAPPLVPVGEVVDEIVRLVVDPSSGGEVRVLDGNGPRPGL